MSLNSKKSLNVSITLTSDSELAVVGNKIQYTLTLTNNSSIEITNITLNCILAKGLSSTPDTLTEFTNFPSYPSIPSKGEKTYSFDVYTLHLPSNVPFYLSTPLATYQYENNGETIKENIEGTPLKIGSTSSILNPVTGNIEQTTYKNTPIKGVVLAVTPTDYQLNYKLNMPATNGYVKINNSTGYWIYTPKVNFIGTDYFSVLVTDEGGGISKSIVTIKIENRPSSFDYVQVCDK